MSRRKKAGKVKSTKARKVKLTKAGKVKLTKAGKVKSTKARKVKLTKAGKVKSTKAGKVKLTKAGKVKLTKAGKVKLTKAGKVKLTKAGKVKLTKTRKVKSTKAGKVKSTKTKKVRSSSERNSKSHSKRKRRSSTRSIAKPLEQKFIFVTGGVVSSIGKGLTAASLGTLLEARGLKVTLMKCDPYINVDPGTMSPFQHGEVYVTEDGAETDLDLGHYERFTNVFVNSSNSITAGQVYENVISKERNGDYLGGDGSGDPPYHE